MRIEFEGQGRSSRCGDWVSFSKKNSTATFGPRFPRRSLLRRDPVGELHAVRVEKAHIAASCPDDAESDDEVLPADQPSRTVKHTYKLRVGVLEVSRAALHCCGRLAAASKPAAVACPSGLHLPERICGGGHDRQGVLWHR